ncbi:MAG: hypothetical protein ACQESJ_09455 [Bacteroidota bacterium]
MKEYQIRTSGLNELEEKLNRFFEQHQNSDLMTITSFGSIADPDFAKGEAKMPVVVSVYYIEPHVASVVDKH